MSLPFRSDCEHWLHLPGRHGTCPVGSGLLEPAEPASLCTGAIEAAQSLYNSHDDEQEGEMDEGARIEKGKEEIERSRIGKMADGEGTLGHFVLRGTCLLHCTGPNTIH